MTWSSIALVTYATLIIGLVITYFFLEWLESSRPAPVTASLCVRLKNVEAYFKNAYPCIECGQTFRARCNTVPFMAEWGNWHVGGTARRCPSCYTQGLHGTFFVFTPEQMNLQIAKAFVEKPKMCEKCPSYAKCLTLSTTV
jgi:hypothetical protein